MRYLEFMEINPRWRRQASSSEEAYGRFDGIADDVWSRLKKTVAQSGLSDGIFQGLRGKLAAEHRQPTLLLCLGCLVLEHVPMLCKTPIFDSDDVGRDERR